MSDSMQLRTAIVGLLGYAAIEEELLLAGLPQPAAEQGSTTVLRDSGRLDQLVR